MSTVNMPGWYKASGTYGKHYFEVSEICKEKIGKEYTDWVRTNDDEFVFANEEFLAWFLLAASHLVDSYPRARWPSSGKGTGSGGPG